MTKQNKGVKSFGAYMIDLMILIFGITISFFLNEWRENIQHRETEKQLLTSIAENLSSDTAQFTEHIFKLNFLIQRMQPFLEEEQSSPLADSIGFYLDAFISYTNYTKIDVGYQEMKATGNSRWIKDKVLLNKIITYYTQTHGFLAEWNGIDKGFVLDQTLPFFQNNFPYSPYENYGELYKKAPQRFEKILQRDDFKNLVRDNILFKSASKYAFEMNKKAGAELISEIRAYLK